MDWQGLCSPWSSFSRPKYPNSGDVLPRDLSAACRQRGSGPDFLRPGYSSQERGTGMRNLGPDFAVSPPQNLNIRGLNIRVGCVETSSLVLHGTGEDRLPLNSYRALYLSLSHTLSEQLFRVVRSSLGWGHRRNSNLSSASPRTPSSRFSTRGLLL